MMVAVAVLVTCTLIAAIILSFELGFRFGLRRWTSVPPGSRTLNSAMEASVFGLMALLVAFIFYGASSRYENRRGLIAQEANIIGTAYRRIDLMPPDAQPQLREAFRSYVRTRLEVFRYSPNTKERNLELAKSAAIQNDIWKQSVAATTQTSPSTQTLVISSLNDLIDITTIQSMARATHPPAAVFAMLFLSVFGSSALAGYSMSASGFRDWVFVAAHAVILGVALYVIVDYEFPRAGLIRIDPFDQLLRDLLAGME